MLLFSNYLSPYSYEQIFNSKLILPLKGIKKLNTTSFLLNTLSIIYFVLSNMVLNIYQLAYK